MENLIAFVIGSVIVWGEGPRLDNIQIAPIVETVDATVYGYTSLPELTDETPTTTASGDATKEGIIANNCHPFYSLVMIDGKIYQVADRMNKRYSCDTFDIFYDTYDEAKKHGKQQKKVYILAYEAKPITQT